jgi:hypothetical protein
MIIWSGWGILAPFLIIAGTLGANTLANSYFGPDYSKTHFWVLGAGLFAGGFLCWLAGQWLYGRSSRVLVDRATGQEVTVGGSHTIFFLPMHWVGTLIMLAAIPAGIYGFPESSRKKNAEKLVGEEAPAVVPPVETAVVPSPYATVDAAQQAALRLHPELGAAGSDFNKAFLALHKKYQAERPELFRRTDWPIVIADEVAKSRPQP